MNPIDHLLAEHRDLLAQFQPVRRVVSDLEARGAAALPQALPELRRFGQVMETQLARHALKEDAALFPAVEAALGESGGPTEVMRAEHVEIHGQGSLLRRTLRELNEVEHPQIEAGRAALNQLTAGGGGAEDLRANAAEILRLIDLHFSKEEDILFPLTRNLLDAAALAAVWRAMEAL